jgi:hypothetical protein
MSLRVFRSAFSLFCSHGARVLTSLSRPLHGSKLEAADSLRDMENKKAIGTRIRLSTLHMLTGFNARGWLLR